MWSFDWYNISIMVVTIQYTLETSAGGKAMLQILYCQSTIKFDSV